MCGIVAVLSRPDGRPMPAPGEVLSALDAAVAVPLPSGAGPDAVVAVARHVQAADRLLRGVAGVSLLAARGDVRAAVVARLDLLDGRADTLEQQLETGATDDIEARNAALVELRDALWAVRRDRLRAAAAVVDLAGRDAPHSVLA